MKDEWLAGMRFTPVLVRIHSRSACFLALLNGIVVTPDRYYCSQNEDYLKWIVVFGVWMSMFLVACSYVPDLNEWWLFQGHVRR